MIEGRLTRAEIARRSRVGAQTLCDWVHRYNEQGLAGLGLAGRPGRPSLLDDGQVATLRSWLGAGPDADAGEPCRWTLGDLRERVLDLFGVSYTTLAVRRLIRRLGFRLLSSRPIHPKADPEAQEEFRQGFSNPARRAIPEGVSPGDVLVHFQDEARIGQKGMLSRVWARAGTRPRIRRCPRYGYCYLFSAFCLQTGTAIGHVCDRANTGEMSRHLADIGKTVPEGKHALAILDGAGWHRAKEPVIPDKVSLLRLPPYSLELNSSETVFLVLKHNHFANRVFDSAGHVKRVVQEFGTGS